MARRIGWPTFWSLYRPARDTPPVPVASHVKALPPPETIRGVDEAFETLLAARLLRGTMSAPKARELISRLSPYRTRLMLRADTNPLDGITDEDVRRMNEATMRFSMPVLADVLLPAARDYVLDRLFRLPSADTTIDPQTLPSVREVAEAMRIVVDTLNGAGRGTIASIATNTEREARAIADSLVQDHGTTGREAIEALTTGLLRVEVLTLTLDALGRDTVLEPTRFQSLRLARYALRRSTEVLEAFNEAPRDLTAFRDSLSVMAAVDALIVIVLRILDAQLETREEKTAFVEPADQTAMGRYLGAAGRMADIALDLAGRAAVTTRVDTIVFDALLRQILWLHRFCAYCGHEARPLGLDQLQTRLVNRTAKLATFAGEALVSATMHPSADPERLASLLRRAQTVARTLQDMDRPAELEALTVRLVAVDETLKTVVPAS